MDLFCTHFKNASIPQSHNSFWVHCVFIVLDNVYLVYTYEKRMVEPYPCYPNNTIHPWVYNENKLLTIICLYSRFK